MYLPHDISLYNIVTKTNADFSETTESYITILHGVFVDASKGRNVSTSGLTSADAVNLYIPLDVEAVDGIEEYYYPSTALYPSTDIYPGKRRKSYISPVSFAGLEDKTKYYTLSFAENAVQTFFIKGNVSEPDLTFEEISARYDNVYTVTKVDLKDFGSTDMQHFEVGGA